MPAVSALFQRASFANGLIILSGCLLGLFEPTRWFGIALGVLMGIGLMVSGMTGFCGWVRIFSLRSGPPT